MSNLLQSLNKMNLLNKPNDVAGLVAQKTGFARKDVETVLAIAKQIDSARYDHIKELQEDILAVAQTIQKETKEYGNRQKITNLHLSEIKKMMNDKSEKVLSNAYQLDFEDILANARTTDQIFNAGITQAKNKRAYNKEKTKIKSAMWRLLKLHLNDIYGTPKTLKQEDFQDYMFTDMQAYIKDLSVTTIRKYMNN
ncbi:hypothetical protein NQ016_03935 [Staphylococcus hyicus]|uniref:hypothetical protein n=2 Tax=Staphylococcus hyicus TaxID=1284 RepID=UPI00211BE388|nr:hypothetical protein [Staphylococcus hyicus]MCQ9290668.1 hypothetical protein [Staphylococcus hyicus]MCQ9305910.1 hypothetical protein [Staphylococcus hyicus]MCQ9308322.1 hypothetical protein [Staphylococcus hyicus]MCQ9310744.1 hypothetical protein [Staphylococcus hyicus]